MPPASCRNTNCNVWQESRCQPTIEEMTLQAAASMESPIEVPPDHPSYAGHFPRCPILPGAVLLDEVLHAIQRARGIDLKDWQIATVKFLDVVRPGDALHLEHAATAAGFIRFTIRAASGVVATGTLSSAPAAGGAPHEP
jgi:3-hydroxyacyl-[acyl-carrier-protein] dehydratase